MMISGSNSNTNISGIGTGEGIDTSTRTLITIEYEHHEIHAGTHFNYCNYLLSAANATVKEFIFITPDTTKWIHLTFGFSSSEGATLELYEGCSNVVGGTPITPRNNNRNFETASVVTLLEDPTSITDGTRAAGFLAGGTREAGFDSRSKENVLLQGTIYMARITSLAVSNDISWCAEWYEHTNKG